MWHVSPLMWSLVAIVLMLLWSSLLALLFWKMAATVLGEEGPPSENGKFDWIQFQVRFFCGFMIGFLLGWRLVRYTTSMKTVFIACLVGGLIGGMAFGLSRPPDFWSRGF
jgi:F0F1-type ATP synthase assembly protein I